LHDLEKALDEIRALAKKFPELTQAVSSIGTRIESFRGFIEYSQLFIRKAGSSEGVELSAAGQVEHVLAFFKKFAEDLGIKIVNEIDPSVKTPSLPVAVYSGVLLNLYTNALKATVGLKRQDQPPRILFRAWNEKKRHVLQVADSGVGIPPQLHRRIWEPLFTTTSDVNNPLGSGMGLGLSLIRQVVAEYDGSATLLQEPPEGFTTCFEIVFPRR
jgi:signal transduction histidine kinase